MGMENIFSFLKKTETTPKQGEDFKGGMTPEAAEELRNKKIKEMAEIKERMGNWTPRQKVAFDFLHTLPGWSKKLEEQKLTLQKISVVEKFSKSPSEVIKSAQYDEESNSFVSDGKIYAGNFQRQ